MDQIKIGKFIADCRKGKNLTQMQLAEKLNITDRAVSKWENGRSLPDAAIMLELCSTLNISVNELLNGERIDMEDNKRINEENIINLVKLQEEKDKMLLGFEIVIGILSVVILLGACAIAAYIHMAVWQKALLIILGFVIGLIGLLFALRIEQKAGFYKCAQCGHTYVPEYIKVFLAMHMGRTRYMECPHCKKYSWQKKVISK